MVLTYDPTTQQTSAALRIDEQIQEYKCGPWVCMNPFCLCNEVLLTLYRTDEKHVIGIDLQNRQLIDREDFSVIDAFAKQFFEQLEESDYLFLQSLYASFKQHAIESADYTELAFEFDQREIEIENKLISYYNTLSYALMPRIEIQGKKYDLDEYFCIKKDCPCTMVALPFYEVSNQQEIHDCAFSLRVDYRSKTWTQDANDQLTLEHTEIQALRLTFENQYPDCYAIFETHHQRLRLLHANYLKHLKPIKTNKVGRNDPCPCGSGKKFKKCCGQ